MMVRKKTVEGKGKQAADMVQAMQESYDEGVTDEFIKPINNSSGLCHDHP